MGTLNEHARYRRRDEFVMRLIAGETVLVPIRNNTADLNAIYNLNEVGTFIWQALAAPVTAAEVAEAVEKEFEAEQDTIGQDVREFLRDLLAIQAIRVVERA